MTFLLLLGAAAIVLCIARAARTPATDPAGTYNNEWEEWEDEDPESPPEEDWWPEDEPRFQPGMMYPWQPIEDLLWAYGYTRDEVHAEWEHNYISICRDGLRAEFDGSLFATDRQGNQLYTCHQFDPQADTSDSDRWRRQPTEDERRRVVYR